MDKLPYFPLYVLDIQADEHVDAMSAEEFGAYMRIIIRAWHQEPVGTVPNDDATLAKWSRLTLARWKKVRPAVEKAFVVGSDGRLHQKRMKKEFSKFKKRSDAARQSANERWAKTCDGNANASPSHPVGNARAYDSENDSDSDSSKDGGSGEGIGLIVREWLLRAKGHTSKLRDHKTLGEFFGELVRRKFPPALIVEKICDPGRDFSQTHWDFGKEYFPKPKPGSKSRPGDPGYYDGIAFAKLDEVEATK